VQVRRSPLGNATFLGRTTTEWDEEIRRWNVFSEDPQPTPVGRQWTTWRGLCKHLYLPQASDGPHGFDEHPLQPLTQDSAEAVPMLIELLRSAHADSRCIAAIGLMIRAKSAGAASTALQAVQHDPDPDVRSAANEAARAIALAGANSGAQGHRSSDDREVAAEVSIGPGAHW
jgi:hypothetical protein